jgi:protein SCO1
MPAPTPDQKTAPPQPARTFPGSWLDARDRRFVAWGLAATVLFAVGLGAIMVGLKWSDTTTADPDAATPVIAPDYPRQLVDFALTDQAGRTITRADFAGQVTLVDFIFTSCSVTCPYVNAQMEKIEQATKGQPVRLISLTLDPVDDTVAVLSSYAPGFGADPARWSFLTGDESVIHRLVATSFLPPDTTGEFSYMPGNFAHVQRIVIIDKSGKIVSYFDGLNPKAADTILPQIQKLEAQP